MNELLPGERALNSDSQLAVRMLYAVVGGSSRSSYASFFSQLTSVNPTLPDKLEPLHVMQYVQRAAGAADSHPTLAVWALDEVNSVQPSSDDALSQDGTRVTFLQKQLSKAVLARESAWFAMRAGGLNLLPVFITASTRGSASSLHSTESRKAKVCDVRLALADQLSDKQLVVMDLFRRLPWPAGSARPAMMPGPDKSLSELSDEEQQQLLDCCPEAVTEVLNWVGSSYRLVEYAVAMMSGSLSNQDLFAGEMIDRTVIMHDVGCCTRGDWTMTMPVAQTTRSSNACNVADLYCSSTSMFGM